MKALERVRLRARSDMLNCPVPPPPLFERPAVLRELQSVEASSRDDVDDAGDGIRPVDRRCAILQHFDVIDDARRNGVEVGRGRDAARRGLVHPAKAVDQHQHAFRAEVAQVRCCCAGADTALVRWKADVAAGVELRVEAAARDRQPLQRDRRPRWCRNFTAIRVTSPS